MMQDTAPAARVAPSLPNIQPVSLIICSRNRPVLLGQAVASILDGDEVPSELIIVDQSDDPNVALASTTTERPCDIRYVWSRVIGLSRANNAGVRLAQHDLLVFTHDDALVAPQWFGAMVRALVREGPTAVVTGMVVPTEPEHAGAFVQAFKTDTAPTVFRSRGYRDVLYPLNMGMHRALLEEVGGFDERLGPGTRFPAAEDNDFALRVLESGRSIVYDPNVVLHHRAWRNDFLRLRWQYGRGRGAFYAKHMRVRDTFMLRRMARDVAVHVLGLPAKMRGQRRAAAGDVMLVLGILAGSCEWRLTSQRRRA
jgi:GT2 family glycosyltransferase